MQCSGKHITTVLLMDKHFLMFMSTYKRYFMFMYNLFVERGNIQVKIYKHLC
mgnify:CR=1 FL=1